MIVVKYAASQAVVYLQYTLHSVDSDVQKRYCLSAQEFSGLTDNLNIITSESLIICRQIDKCVPSEMALMFSSAACADLKGKNAARLTMLLNFPMLSTLASTCNTTRWTLKRLHLKYQSFSADGTRRMRT